MANKFFAAIKARFFGSPSDTAIDIGVNNDANPRISIDAGGRINWGDGSSSVDTNLYRDGVNVLKTDDTFKAPALFVDNIEVDTTGATSNQFLIFDGTKFAPNNGAEIIPLTNLSDVGISTVKNGQLLQFDGTSWVNSVAPSFEPIGHEDKTDSTISFNNTNRTFSIAPVLSSHNVWCVGVRYVKTTTETVVIPNTTGIYYIYYNSSGVLSYKTTYFTWDTDTPTAYIYWNANTAKAEFFGDERHGVTLDWQTHEYLHRTRGAVIASGFGASNFVTNGDGSLDSHAQIDIADGTFFDEDMQVDITHSTTPVANTWQQFLEGGAKIPVFRLDGTEWVSDTATSFPIKQGVATPRYNSFSTPNWGLTDLSNNKLGISWIIATNNLNNPVIAILGQSQYNQLSDAEAATWESLSLTNFPVFEFRPLYKIVYEAGTSFTNTPKAAIRGVYDLRRVTTAGTAIPTVPVADHGNLTGLSDDDHLQYVHLYTPRSISASHTFINGLASTGAIRTDSLFVDNIEVDTTGAALNQVLKFNGSKFLPTGTSTNAIAVISDTAPITAQTGDLWYDSSRGALYVYYDSAWIETGGPGAQGPAGTMVQLFTIPGVVTTGSGKGRYYAPTTMVISNIRAFVDTAPTGADLIIDVNRNGTTIFTTQGNRPRITAGNNYDAASTPDVTGLAAGDYVTIDVDQIGSTVAGSYLTVQVEFAPVIV